METKKIVWKKFHVDSACWVGETEETSAERADKLVEGGFADYAPEETEEKKEKGSKK